MDRPLSERKLAAMFGRTSRCWAATTWPMPVMAGHPGDAGLYDCPAARRLRILMSGH
jgi:hypothetical protein